MPDDQNTIKNLTKRKITVPDDFDSEESFIRHVRETFDDDYRFDKDNREAALEDFQFLVGDQWPDQMREDREDAFKPVLTINRLPAFVSQVIGERRINETTINVLPEHGGTKDIAEIRKGLIRNIEKTSKSHIAYNTAMMGQVAGGIGNFQVHLEYASDDVFEQDIKIAPIPNALSVVWDRMSIDPTGEDAGHVFVVDSIPKKEFEQQYPEKEASDISSDPELTGDLMSHGWLSEDDVRVVSYWRMRTRPKLIMMTTSGTIMEAPEDKPVDEWIDTVAQRADGSPMIREVDSKYAEMYLVTGSCILEGPYELPIPSVPVFRVPAWEVNVGEIRHRWGLIRFLKDPQRLHNYWRSVIAEKLMLSPKAKWIASDESIEGFEDDWRNAHLSDSSVLVYRAAAAVPPKEAPPSQMEPALINEAGMATQDIRDVSNIHEASLGQQSNEVSGKAILARKQVAEVGTALYQDNLNLAIQRCGTIVNALIPITYDTHRMIKTLGEDEAEKIVEINNPADPRTNITSGKYSVNITTGPSYMTKRVEASESMLNLINAMPNVVGVAADMIIEAQDWPDSDKIAKRVRGQLPPGVIPQDELSDEEIAQQEQSQEQQATAVDLEMRRANAEIAEIEANAAEAMANAARDNAEAEKIKSETGLKAAQTELDAVDKRAKNELKAAELDDKQENIDAQRDDKSFSDI